MKLSDIKINSTAIEQGAWIEDIPDMGDLRLKVRGIGNSDFRVLQSRLFEATPRAQRSNGRLSPEAADRVTVECLVETILVDWEGMLSETNEPVPYDKMLARKILANPDLIAFREAVMWASGRVGEARSADSEAVAKN